MAGWGVGEGARKLAQSRCGMTLRPTHSPNTERERSVITRVSLWADTDAWGGLVKSFL